MRPLLALLAFGCAGSADPTPSPCDDDPRAVPLEVGATFEGETLSVVVTALDPDPPEVGANTWEIEVPVGGCALDVQPWMPDHGHGGAGGTASELAPGRWRLEGIDLRMGGFWEVGVVLDCGDAGAETIDVLVCVDA